MNELEIGTITRQITATCERIDSLSCSIKELENLNQLEIASTFDDQRIGQLADLQQLVLILTGLITPEHTAVTDINADEGEGSVFAKGDLTNNLGDKTDGIGECGKK